MADNGNGDHRPPEPVFEVSLPQEVKGLESMDDIQKHEEFEAEVQAHSDAVVQLDKTGYDMIAHGHYDSNLIRKRLDELHRLWDQLLRKLAGKGDRLQKALKLLQFTRQCDELMYWIKDKEAFMTTEKFGQDLEHVEVSQGKFDEFLKDLSTQQFRIKEVNTAADKLFHEGHLDVEIIEHKRDELIEAWRRLNELAASRKERLFGAYEMQRFNRDIDETLAWIAEKDAALSTDDYSRDLTTVEAVQRKHEGTETDLVALEQTDGKKDLTDDEILRLLDSKRFSIYDLERELGDKDSRAVAIRRKWLNRRLYEDVECPSTVDIPYLSFNYSLVTNACCENVIGYVPMPLGFAGPLTVDGHNFFIPMATTEGCLVASTNRGCRAVSAGTGVRTAIFRDSMSRAPVVEFENIEEAAAFMRWLEKTDNFRIMKQQFDATSRYVKLKSVKPLMAGRKVYIRFTATTGDAMGMNMVSKATEAVLTILRDRYFNNMAVLSLSGNVCVDKKAAAMNWIEGRGKSVVAETIVSRNVVQNVLKTGVQQLVQLNSSKNLIGSAVAGAVGGFNAHSANIVTAVFLACGQDAAQVVTSSNCLTELEETEKGDLRISCTMPSLEVGTIGGGTILPAQRACLDMLGVAGGNPSEPGANSKQFARIICAAVLAGELSLLAALSSGHLVRSHMKHNRSSVNLASQDVRTSEMMSKSSVSERPRRPQDDNLFEGSIMLQPETCSKVLV